MSNQKENFLQNAEEQFKKEAKVSENLQKNVNRLLDNLKKLETIFTKESNITK